MRTADVVPHDELLRIGAVLGQGPSALSQLSAQQVTILHHLVMATVQAGTRRGVFWGWKERCCCKRDGEVF
jgi:hypothetical protein